MKKKNKYPATCIVHWATGPVNCCDKHAKDLIAVGKALDTHVVATELIGKAECSNCVSESEGKR